MGKQVLCDGCGVDVQHLDTFVLQAGFLERGLVQADLCPDCAAPFWATELGQKLLDDAESARIAEQERRAPIIEEAARAAMASVLPGEPEALEVLPPRKVEQ